MANRIGLKVAAVVLAAASMLTACSTTASPSAAPSGGASEGTKKLVIGAAFPILDEWLQTLADGMQKAADANGNIDLKIVAADEKTDVQLGQVENFVSQGVDGIIVIATDVDATDPMTDAAKSKDIPLVYVNRKPSNQPDDVGFIGSDGVVAGTLLMTELAKLSGGKGNVAILEGIPGDFNAITRTQGCKDVVGKNPDMKVVFDQAGNFYRDKGQSITENWLQSGTPINAICANNDEMALGAINAIKAAGKTPGKDIFVGGVDATKDALAAMKSGSLSVTVFQDAPGQGKAAVETIVKMAGGQKLTAADNYIDVPFQLVTPENLADFE